MKIKVLLYATFARGPRGQRTTEERELDLEEGAAIRDLIKKLSLPEGVPKFVFVNRKKIKGEELVLRDGDEVGIFPPIAGGAKD